MIRSMIRSTILNGQWYRSAAGAGGVAAGDFELIRTELITTPQSSVVFDVTGLGSTYRHLQLRTVVRWSSTSGNESSMNLRFNGDTGTNYNIHGLFGDGSTVGSFGVANTNQIPPVKAPTANFTANVFAPGVIDILDAFSSTKNKTVRSLTGFAGLNEVSLRSGAWRNTNALTSITLYEGGSGSNFVAGCRLSLYGIRG